MLQLITLNEKEVMEKKKVEYLHTAHLQVFLLNLYKYKYKNIKNSHFIYSFLKKYTISLIIL